MSRREFRAEVADARPVSAWVLVVVASATLWITQQLYWWAIAAQVGGILFSLLRRKHPLSIQRSAVALNLNMLAIVAVTISVAFRTGASTIALAHFAALTQGLQLMDARPRKSEFLLVTLALFQVILASSLTDSVLFPPLLAVFVASCTWTLVVHTLRTEALEAGDLAGAARALTPMLLRTTLVASTLSIALALVFFVLLPRMRSGVVQAPFGQSGALAGFSDRVELGTIGRIRTDTTVVLRVLTSKGRPPEPYDAYWKGLAFDHFDGREWAVTPAVRSAPIGSPRFGISLGSEGPGRSLEQVIVREPVKAGVLFGMGRARHLSGSIERVETDPNGGLYAPSQLQERVRYTLRSEIGIPSEELLRADHAVAPARRGGRYLELPALAPEVEELAREITRESTSDAERVRAIETWLRRRGRYTDTPPVLSAPGERSPVEAFLLGELAGHCEYFASGMVVLARSIGVPSRLVNGFAGGRENTIGGFVELARADAHAWVEVHFGNAGWVRYDPTPPDLRLRAQSALGMGEQLAQLASVIELWWFQRVVDFDSSDQIRAFRSAWGAWQAFRFSDEDDRVATASEPTRSQPRWGSPSALAWRGLAVIFILALGATLVMRSRRGRRVAGVPESYARALRILARHGLHRPAAFTARDFAEQVRASAPAAASAFERLTEAYLLERFGGRRDPRADQYLREFQQELRSGRLLA